MSRDVFYPVLIRRPSVKGKAIHFYAPVHHLGAVINLELTLEELLRL